MKPWWQRLLGYAPKEAWGLGAVGTLTLLSVAIETLKPWPMKLLVDNVLEGKGMTGEVDALLERISGDAPTAQVGLLALATVLLAVASNLLGAVQRYVQTLVGGRIHYRLAEDVFAQLQQLSLSFHARSQAGDLMRRVMSDSGCVKDLILSVCLPAITALLSLVAMFGVMWALSPMLALLALVAAVPLVWLMHWLSGRMSDTVYVQQQMEGQLNAVAEQSLGALPLVQAFGRERRERERFRKVSRQTLGAYLSALAPQLQFRIGVGAVMATATAALLTLGGLRVMEGELTIGTLLVSLSYLASLYAPLETLAYLSVSYAGAAAGARRVLEVLDATDKVSDKPDAIELPKDGQRGTVRLESVCFGYEPGHPVLKDVTLEVRPGEMVALVGATGSGKTTLAMLISRFYDTWQGQVLVNGVDVRTVKLASLRAEIALVPQEPFLLPLSVADNIAYGRPDASWAEIEAAAKAANAHEFIERMPQGYDTVLGERGVTLSGGQRQRLSIARALLKDAPILILDEPTSALDNETERSVMDALHHLMKGRTTLMIAHRPTTIQRADREVVLNGGVLCGFDWGKNRSTLKFGP
ncbi:MAG: hypothetical protein RLZZ555_138 [Pseudomonadota bacterium]